MSDSSFEVSSTMTVSIPEKSPSCESMLIERNRILSSLLMMEVMFVTIPISSCPTIRSVMGYCLPWLFPRSEERRVGKECRIGCRSRWSPYH